jgi:Flp pilus assembly pilin Flp
MKTLQFISHQLWQHEEGQDLIEYALLVALIALVAFGAVSAVGNAVFGSFWAVIAQGLAVS